MTVTLVDTATGAPGAGVTTFAASLVGATASNGLLWVIGGDKNSGTITPPTDTPTLLVDLRTTNGDGHVTLGLAYGTADGGETSLSGSVVTNTAGGQVWVAELADSVGTGAWAPRGSYTFLTDFSAVTGLTLGPVSVTLTGLIVAAVAADSVNTQGTVTWTSGSGHTFTARRATASGGGQAGLWVATAPVTAGDSVSVTFARAGGTADQHSGLMTVFARDSTTTGVVAGLAPNPAGALATTLTDPAAVAGAAPRPTGALAAGVIAAGVVAGSAPRPTGALLVVTADPNLGALAGAAPRPSGALVAASTDPAVVAGAAPRPSGALAGQLRQTAVLAGSAPRPRGRLTDLVVTYPLTGGSTGALIAGGPRAAGGAAVADSGTRAGPDPGLGVGPRAGEGAVVST